MDIVWYLLGRWRCTVAMDGVSTLEETFSRSRDTIGHKEILDIKEEKKNG